MKYLFEIETAQICEGYAFLQIEEYTAEIDPANEDLVALARKHGGVAWSELLEMGLAEAEAGQPVEPVEPAAGDPAEQEQPVEPRPRRYKRG